jgi:hypothetical protein
MSGRSINPLQSAEIRIFLKAGGIDLTDDQLTRLRPYLVPLRRVEVVIGSVHSEASEFARRGSIVLAFDHASRMLATSDLQMANRPLRNMERHASPEMAVRMFLSLEDPAHGRRRRARLSDGVGVVDVVTRLLLVLLVSACAIAALFYIVPSLQLFRSVATLAVILAVCGVFAASLVFNRRRGP